MGTPVLNVDNIDEIKMQFRAIVMYMIRHVHVEILTIKNIDNKTPLECVEIGGFDDAVIEEFREAIEYRRLELGWFPSFK